MKKKFLSWCLALCLIVPFAVVGTACDKQVTADIVVYGDFFTGDLDSRAKAVAIKDGKYIFVGEKNDAEKYIGTKTNVIDNTGKFGITGFTDAHTHAYVANDCSEMGNLELSELTTKDQIFEAIENYVTANPDKEFYIGFGWQYGCFENGMPSLVDLERLDGICPDKPIFLKAHDCHSCWINTKFMMQCEITKDTVSPMGGIIEKDKNGNLLGVFCDTAMEELVKTHLPKYSVEDYKKIILKAQENYAQFGYTAYLDVFIEDQESNANLYQAYEELDDAGLLTLYVQGAWVVENNDNISAQIANIVNKKEESKGGNFELTDVKIFMDGVGDIGTAYMLDPYSEDYKGKYFFGEGRWTDVPSYRRLVNAILQANQNGLVAHLHAIGDAGMREGLDAIEEAQNIYKNPHIKNVITHCQYVAQNDYSRFKELDVIVNADTEWGVALDGSYDKFEVTRFGEERAYKAFPYRSLYNAGAIVSFATDNPCGGTGNPIVGFYVATHRFVKDITEIRNGDEALTYKQAIEVMTTNCAIQMRKENSRGQIKVGYNADLVMYGSDFLNLDDPLDFADCAFSLLLTVANGKIVYQLTE